jgi:hypothetical protein
MAKKKYFYPPAPPVGSETFSDNIVGNQITDGGGLTNGVFEFTPVTADKANRSFDLGVFSDPISLNGMNIKNVDEVKSIIEKNFKVYPNFDFSQITSFTEFGSLQKRISVAIVNIINHFPGSLQLNKVKVGSFQANTVFNAEYDSIRDETSFEINTKQITNPFGIDYTKNSKRAIETSNIPVSKYRSFSEYFKDYSLYTAPNVSFNITDFEPTTLLNNGNLFFTVKGNPFSGSTGWTNTLVIRPNDETVEKIFNEEMDEVENFLLNRNTLPKYTSKFTYDYFDVNGQSIRYESKCTWPLIDQWNLDIKTNDFDKYLKKLNDAALNMDTAKTNLISRFLTTGSFKDFDTPDQRMEKVLQIYGRSFDEVKKFIDSLAYMNSVNYIVGNDIPSQLLKNLSQTLGLNSNISQITNKDLMDSVFNTSNKQIYAGKVKSPTPVELDFQYYRNLILNAAYMFKSKGTRKSLEYIMRMIGAPDALLEFNEVVYLADAPIRVDKFNEQFACLSGGTIYVETPTLDPNNTFQIQGVTYTGYSTDGVIRTVTNALDSYGIDNRGYPKSPKATESNFFQKGSGWFEKTPHHRSDEEIDTQNSSFNNTNPFIVSKLKSYTYGQDYMDKFRNFDSMTNIGYTLTKVSDNQKSWPSEMVGNRKDNKNFNGVDYKVKNDKLVINSKNIELYTNIGQGITYDVWQTSVKYGYPISNTPLTAPYPAPGNIDWTSINPKPNQKTFF